MFFAKARKRKKERKEAARLAAERKLMIKQSVSSQIQAQKAEDLKRAERARLAPKTVIDAPREFGRKSVFGSGARKSDDHSDDTKKKG